MKESSPIFIIGAARSGTSIIAGALKVAAGIPGHNEGHYLSMMEGLIQTATTHLLDQRKKDPSDKVMMAHITTETLTEDIMEMMKKRMDLQFPNEEVWFDKTPDGNMVRMVPFIIKMWPKARFIFTKRRSIENIASRLRKFKHLTFERNCLHWANVMKRWQYVRAELPKGSWIEIEQRETGLNPEKVGEELGAFLALDEKQIAAMKKFLKTERYEFSGGDEKNTKGLNDMGWTEEELKVFKELCSPLNVVYGYSEDSSYYL